MKPGEMASELLDIECLAMELVATQMEDAALRVLRDARRELLVLRHRLNHPRQLEPVCFPSDQCPLCDTRRAS